MNCYYSANFSTPEGLEEQRVADSTGAHWPERAHISDIYTHNCLYTGAFVIIIIKLVYLCIVPSAIDVKTIKISAETQRSSSSAESSVSLLRRYIHKIVYVFTFL